MSTTAVGSVESVLNFRFDIDATTVKGLPDTVVGCALSWVKGDIRKSTSVAPVQGGVGSWDAAKGLLSVETTLRKTPEGDGYEDKFLRFSVKQTVGDKLSNLGHFMVKVSRYALSKEPEAPKRFPIVLNNSTEKASVALSVTSVCLDDEFEDEEDELSVGPEDEEYRSPTAWGTQSPSMAKANAAAAAAAAANNAAAAAAGGGGGGDVEVESSPTKAIASPSRASKKGGKGKASSRKPPSPKTETVTTPKGKEGQTTPRTPKSTAYALESTGPPADQQWAAPRDSPQGTPQGTPLQQTVEGIRPSTAPETPSGDNGDNGGNVTQSLLDGAQPGAQPPTGEQAPVGTARRRKHIPSGEEIAKLAAANREASAAKADAAEAVAEAKAANEKAEESQLRFEAQAKQLALLREEVAALSKYREQAAGQAAQLAELKASVAASQGVEEGEEESEVVLSLRREVFELQRENRRLAATEETLSVQHGDSRDEHVANLQRDLIAAKIALAECQSDLDELKNSLSKGSLRLDETATDLEALRSERKQLQSRLLEAEDELRSGKRAQNRLLKEVETLRRSQMQAEQNQSGSRMQKGGGSNKMLIGAGGEDEEQETRDLHAYARFLGLDPVDDPELMWIAVEGLSAELPDKWTEHVDGDGNIFYWNSDTESSQWHHPCDEIYKSFATDAKTEKATRKHKVVSHTNKM